MKKMILLVSSLALLPACGLIPGLGGGTPSAPASFRVVHAVSDAPSISVAVDGKILNEGQPLAFKASLPANSEATLYRTADAGDRKFAITAAGSIDKLLEETVKLESGKTYTIAVIGTASKGDDGGDAPRPLQFKVFEDDLKPSLDVTKFKLRWIHAAASVMNTGTNKNQADVYFTSPGQDIGALTPGTTLYAAQSSKYLETASGQYQLRGMALGSATAVLDSGAISLAGGRVYTALLVNPLAGPASGVVLLEDFRSPAP